MKKTKLPWWTWVVPLPILVLGTFLSLPFFPSPGVYWLYFPINLGVVMALWWGPRVLFSVFLNSILCFYLMGLPSPQLYPLFAVPETLEVFLSMVIMHERFKDKNLWSPNPKNISYLIVFGLVIPAIAIAVITQLTFMFAGIIEIKNLLWSFAMTAVGDITGAMFMCLPLTILLSPILFQSKLSVFPSHPLPSLRWSMVSRKEKINFLLILPACLAIGISVPLKDSWYVYGIVILLSAAWYGLYAALLMNTWTMGIAIFLPAIMGLSWSKEPISLETPATLLTLSFCAIIAGSAVTALTEKIGVLKRIEEDLKVAKNLAEEASAAKSDFLARMSHEIRTPLNSILGMLELLKETQLNEDQSRYLTLFSHAGENLKALINDLLDFSKIEAKALSIETISFNLHSTIRSVFEILQIKAEEKGLNFELHIDPDVPSRQWGDPTRIRQILFNLIGNALKFTNEGDVIVSVKIEKNQTERLVLEIDDTGIGIPREKQSEVFSPFFQADPSTTRKFGGTGLGLVISKNLAEIMGGTIEMKSLQGRGTRFRVLLPNRPDLSTTPPPKPPPIFFWETNPPSEPFNILLVDDSEDNRVLMIHYLKNLPFRCTEATNGQEAVDKFKMNRFDLVFMDMQMPIMNGYKATEIIRLFEKESSLAKTPIIALTATAVVEDLQRALKSGCDHYAVKPVKKKEVLEILSQNLQAPGDSTSKSHSPQKNFSLAQIPPQTMRKSQPPNEHRDY